MIADRRLYLNSARDRVVEESDSEAAYLLAAKGQEIPKPYRNLVPAPKAVNPEAIDDRQTRVITKTAKC